MSRYSRAVRLVAGATDLTFRQVQSLYRGQPAKLQRSVGTDFIGISVGRFRYEKRITELKKELGVARPLAQDFYNTRDKIGKPRIEKHTVTETTTINGIPPSLWLPHSRLLKKGPDAGKRRVFIDQLRKTPVSGAAAKKLRDETRVERMALQLIEKKRKWGSYSRLHKFFRVSDRKKISRRKNKRPTLLEARRAAKAIIKHGKKNKKDNQKLFDYWMEKFGGSW